MPSKKRKGKKGNKGPAPKDPPPPAQTVETQQPDDSTKKHIKKRCPFFLYGICRYGDNCRNVHDQISAETNTEPAAVVKLTTTLCTRHRAQIQKPNTSTHRGTLTNWVEAPEFVPNSFWSSFAINPPSVPKSCWKTFADPPESVRKSCWKTLTEAHESVPKSCWKTLTEDPESVPKSCWNATEDPEPESVPKSCWNTTEDPESVPKSCWNTSEDPESVPKSCWKSFAEALKTSLPANEPPKELCPYFALFFQCPMGKSCPYVHGRRCDLCQMASLHPFDEGQRKRHLETCEKELVEDMEKSFAIQGSRDKVCGICQDVVWEKERVTDRRFGILERCNHVFCLSCIRTWRRMGKPDDPAANPPTPTEHMPTRMCPECRTHSNFFVPSKFWAEGKDKVRVIQDFKASLGKTKCMYFKSGRGRCPFGGMCFYLHATSDGTKVELPPPPGNRWRRGADGEADIMEAIYLWDFLETQVDDAHNV